MTDPSRHFLVRCAGCELVWSLTALPVGLAEAGKLAQRAQCPRCDGGRDQLFLANEAQARAWALQQDRLVGATVGCCGEAAWRRVRPA